MMRSKVSVAGTFLLGVAAALMAPGVFAYDQYSQNRDATNCRACHGSFRASPYVSLSDGQSWNDDLHDVHRNTMLNGDCDTCHLASGRFPVRLDSAVGGAGLAAISCTGCHGRSQDASSGTQGAGAGLRQHHYRAGETGCVSCHADSNPAAKTPVGENVLPPYYANPGSGHPAIPNDACNPPPGFPENFAGTTLGLDNDGDGVYDAFDADCGPPAVCGNGTVETGEQCDDGNTANGDCCSSTCQFEASGSTCNDGLFCNVGETCNGTGVCGGGSPRDCSDADICTDDSCNETSDVCDHVFDPTNDPSCAALVCGNGTLDAGEQCDDGNTANGDCCSSTCQFEASGSVCDDGLFCNAGETCDGAGVCGGGAPLDCSDGVGCTVDSCDEAGDQCLHAPNDAACDDGLFCNGTETCSATLDCQAGTPVNCDDADICTDDACNETSDACDHVFDPTNDPSCVATACGNGRVEPGEQCDDGNTADGDCCSSTCQFEASGSVCDDGLFCNAGETCDGAGVCGGGAPLDCSDGVGCTVDSCDEAGDQCLHAPNNAACDDGLFCNGTETCSAILDCQAGTPVNCDDADVCTDDACNETQDRCDNVFDPTNDPSCAALVCGNGTLDPGEQCDDGNTTDGDCCSSTCQFETSGSSCSDGLFCNAGETCDGAGVCGGGAPLDCSDGVGCTVDSCDEAGNQCLHAPNNAACDDGLFCNGAEVCNAVAGCQAGTPVNCDDADICTDDSCNESADACDNIFDRTNDPSCDAACPDQDGDGFSPAGSGCGPVDCDDSDATIRPGAVEVCDDDKDNDCDGRIDAADEACGGVPRWSVRPGPLADANYAGSETCAACHPSQFETWSGSLHARMMVRPGDAQAAGFPLPDDSSVPGTTVSIQSWSDVLFVLGQKWRSIWVDRSGQVQGAQWDYRLGRWSPTPRGDYTCGACHTTGYNPVLSFELGGSILPGVAGTWVEYNIGCEACHGPGADHAASPRRDNINRITLDWTGTGEGILLPLVRSAQVCGNCHYRTDHSSSLDPQRRNQAQFNEWSAGPHASSLEPTTLSTYCAKCHSPGNATADSEEHYFTYFDPTEATQVACVSCHDPHKVSGDRWQTLQWPPNGRQDPADHPAAIATYRGTDGNPATDDHAAVPANDTNSLCTNCHTMQPGFRRHVDASPPTVISLYPPFNGGEPFVVPHMEHVEEGNAECVDCHMPRSRTSINPGDVRSHTGLPNEVGVGGTLHFDTTCGQCHDDAQDCVWCHSDFARKTAPGTARPTDRRTAGHPERKLPRERR